MNNTAIKAYMLLAVCNVVFWIMALTSIRTSLHHQIRTNYLLEKIIKNEAFLMDNINHPTTQQTTYNVARL